MTDLDLLQSYRDILHKAGIVEIAARNPNVMEYIKHWETRAEEAEAKLEEAVKTTTDVATSLLAAISLLERGGKKAAASDKMFAQMLVDYNASLDRARAFLANLERDKL